MFRSLSIFFIISLTYAFANQEVVLDIGAMAAVYLREGSKGENYAGM